MEQYSRVQLLTDKYQSEGARRFDVGYIIEVYSESKYEIEFSGPDGITTAQVVASEEELQLAPVASPELIGMMLSNPIEEHKL